MKITKKAAARIANLFNDITVYTSGIARRFEKLEREELSAKEHADEMISIVMFQLRRAEATIALATEFGIELPTLSHEQANVAHYSEEFQRRIHKRDAENRMAIGVAVSSAMRQSA